MLKEILEQLLPIINYKFSFRNKVCCFMIIELFTPGLQKHKISKRCSTLRQSILSFEQIITKVGKVCFTT